VQPVIQNPGYVISMDDPKDQSLLRRQVFRHKGDSHSTPISVMLSPSAKQAASVDIIRTKEERIVKQAVTNQTETLISAKVRTFGAP
jgi:hypothetical protein